MKLKNIFSTIRKSFCKNTPITDTEITILEPSHPYPMYPLNDAERAIYQQSHQWMDHDVYIQHKNWYATQEQMMREQMYQWARLQNGEISMADVANNYKRHFGLLKLNKNTRVL